MKFIIKKTNTNTYLCTKHLDVYNEEFARRFNSEKQAKAYAGSSNFRKGEYVLVSVTDNIGDMTDIVSLKERVSDTVLKDECIRASESDTE